jgi:hypothetical protein
MILSGGTEVLNEPILCDGRHEITRHGGWRAYTATLGR